ncbi:MAG TPA: hypothetical protein VF516_29850 [Kofleriaceae bacterium]
MKKMWISGGIVAAVLLSGAGAYAGYKASIGAPSISSTFAVGVMGAARATSDSNSYAGCSLLNSGTTTLGFCTVADATGATKTCSFSNPAMAQAVASITPDSAIRLFFDASGNCTQLYVDTYSFYLPATP